MSLLISTAGATALALWASAPQSPEGSLADMPRTWAGHQVALGRRDVPFQGEVETRTDTYVIGKLRERDGHLVLEQQACRVRFKPVGGVKVSLDVDGLPPSELHLADDGEGGFRGRSLVAWAREDIDHDGNEGLTVKVRAPVCSGELYVANRSFTEATASLSPSRITGHAEVHVVQTILGARGACLSVVAEGTNERQSGPFAFVPVENGATCDSLFAAGWPVDATTSP